MPNTTNEASRQPRSHLPLGERLRQAGNQIGDRFQRAIHGTIFGDIAHFVSEGDLAIDHPRKIIFNNRKRNEFFENGVYPDLQTQLEMQFELFFEDIPLRLQNGKEQAFDTSLRHIQSRKGRYKELASPELQETFDTMRRYYNVFDDEEYAFTQDICMDARVLGKFIGGVLPGFSDTHASLGGEYSFSQYRLGRTHAKRDERWTVNEGSGLDGRIKNLVRKGKGNIAYVSDVHCECAACKLRHPRLHHIEPSDYGLHSAMKRRSLHIDAVYNHLDPMYQSRFAPVITNYDPETGSISLGLEKSELLEEYAETGYVVGDQKDMHGVHSCLTKLESEGKIITGSKIAQVLETEFRAHYFRPDWVRGFTTTARSIWKNISGLADDKSVMERIRTEVQKVYGIPAKASSSGKRQEELRCRILLANAYSHYIHTRNDAGDHVDFPYSKHIENVIQVSKRKLGPFSKNGKYDAEEDLAEDALVVPPGLGSETVNAIDIAINIINKNRDDGRVPGKRGGTIPIIIKSPVAGLSAEDLRSSSVRRMIMRFCKEIEEGSWTPALHGTIFPRNSLAIHVQEALHTMALTLRQITKPEKDLSHGVWEGKQVIIPIITSSDGTDSIVLPLGNPKFYVANAIQERAA